MILYDIVRGGFGAILGAVSGAFRDVFVAVRAVRVWLPCAEAGMVPLRHDAYVD